MADSFYGSGNLGVVPTTADEDAPSILFACGAAAAGANVTDDVIAINAVRIKHTGTTDGTTASASWLRVRVTDIAGKSQDDVLMPGDVGYFQSGAHTNMIALVEAWTVTAGGTSAGAANVCVTIGAMIKKQ